MADKPKAEFKERTVAQIKALNPKVRDRFFVKHIADLHQDEALIIRAPLVPPNFAPRVSDPQARARLYFKFGKYCVVDTPRTIAEARQIGRPLFEFRNVALKQLKCSNHDAVRVLGYVMLPPEDAMDRTPIAVPFASINYGTWIFSYSENLPDSERIGIKFKAYADAEWAAKSGAGATVRVPSRREKADRYEIDFSSVPVVDNKYKFEIALQFKAEGKSPHELHLIMPRKRYIHGPHAVAGMLAVTQAFAKRRHNPTLVPWHYNIYAKPSTFEATFWNKVGNNVLLQDKFGLRKPYYAERSILAAQSVAAFGALETMFWNPETDKLLKDYPWNPRRN